AERQPARIDHLDLARLPRERRLGARVEALPERHRLVRPAPGLVAREEDRLARQKRAEGVEIAIGHGLGEGALGVGHLLLRLFEIHATHADARSAPCEEYEDHGFRIHALTLMFSSSM